MWKVTCFSRLGRSRALPANVFNRQLVELLKDSDLDVGFYALDELERWGHILRLRQCWSSLPKSLNCNFRSRTSELLRGCGWGISCWRCRCWLSYKRIRSASIGLVQQRRWRAGGRTKSPCGGKLFRAKWDAELVVYFLLAAANGGAQGEVRVGQSILGEGTETERAGFRRTPCTPRDWLPLDALATTA